MSEFLTQSKSYRVWLIIMAALLSLIIIGMAYEIQQTQKRTRSV